MPIIITMAFSINILNARGCRAIIHPRTSGSPERWLLLNEKRDYNKRGIIRRVEEMQADFYYFFFSTFFLFPTSYSINWFPLQLLSSLPLTRM